MNQPVLKLWGWKFQGRHWFWEEKINMKIWYEKREILSKQHENIQKVYHMMKVNNEKAIQVNNEHKINVDEQHVDMKHLK